jgi:hypothetical protein
VIEPRWALAHLGSFLIVVRAAVKFVGQPPVGRIRNCLPCVTAMNAIPRPAQHYPPQRPVPLDRVLGGDQAELEEPVIWPHPAEDLDALARGEVVLPARRFSASASAKCLERPSLKPPEDH